MEWLRAWLRSLLGHGADGLGQVAALIVVVFSLFFFFFKYETLIQYMEIKVSLFS